MSSSNSVPNEAQGMQKLKFCMFHLQGVCKYSGSSCLFAHSVEEIHQARSKKRPSRGGAKSSKDCKEVPAMPPVAVSESAALQAANGLSLTPSLRQELQQGGNTWKPGVQGAPQELVQELVGMSLLLEMLSKDLSELNSSADLLMASNLSLLPLAAPAAPMASLSGSRGALLPSPTAALGLSSNFCPQGVGATRQGFARPDLHMLKASGEELPMFNPPPGLQLGVHEGRGI